MSKGGGGRIDSFWGDALGLEILSSKELLLKVVALDKGISLVSFDFPSGSNKFSTYFFDNKEAFIFLSKHSFSWIQTWWSEIKNTFEIHYNMV